nr:DDE-type integrase/transposase/recombinase [Bacillus cereus]
MLNQNFVANKPNQIWISDITYIHTDEGWLYLASIMDLYTRKIVGWHLDACMTKELVIQALQRGLDQETIAEGIIAIEEVNILLMIIKKSKKEWVYPKNIEREKRRNPIFLNILKCFTIANTVILHCSIYYRFNFKKGIMKSNNLKLLNE